MVAREEIREGRAKIFCKYCGQTEELACNISEGGCVELQEFLDELEQYDHSQGVALKGEEHHIYSGYYKFEPLIKES